MSRLPRILPLTAIAVGGVLGIKVLADAQAVPQALAGARAWAEEAAAKAKADPKAPAGKAETAQAGRTSTLPPTATPGPVTVCAPSAAELAKSAGLSPAELQVLQSLGTRRGQLDARETDIDTQMALLAAAELKLDAKIKSLNGLKAEMAALLGQVDKKQDEETLRLVSVYEKMKPKDAAALMSALDDKVRIPVAAKMKDRALAAILSAMPTPDGKHITEALAQRYAAVQAASQAMNAPPAPAAATAAAPGKAAPPAADAKASAAKAGLDPAAEKAAPAPAKPKAVARKARPKAKPKAVAKADPAPAEPAGREYPKPPPGAGPSPAPAAATPPAAPPA